MVAAAAIWRGADRQLGPGAVRHPARLLRLQRPDGDRPPTSKVKISGSFLALVLAMVFLGGTPAAVIGVMTIFVGWLRWRDAWHYLLNNVLTYATFPLVDRDRLPLGGHRPRDHRHAADLLRARLRRLPGRAGDQLHDDRQLRLLPGTQLLLPQGAHGAVPAAALRARGGADGGRRRLPLRPGGPRRGRAVRRRPGHLPVPARRPAHLPAAGRGAGAAQQAARQLPGRDVERDAAHARPARSDDRPPQRRRRPLLAGDRPAVRATRAGRRSWSTSPRCCTTSASSSSPTASSRRTCR